MILPRFHSSGIIEVALQALNKSVRASTRYWSVDLSSSGRILSRPAALPFLNACKMIAFFVSTVVIVFRFTGRLGIGFRRLGLNTVVGAGWFRTSLKCSTHQSSCSCRVERALPSRSLIGTLLPDGELVSFEQSNISYLYCFDLQLLVPQSLSD